MDERVCRRCLLRDMAENDYYDSVVKYRASLPERLRTEDGEYEARIAACAACNELVNGTCGQCGCYVEMRAAAKAMHCPRPVPLW